MKNIDNPIYMLYMSAVSPFVYQQKVVFRSFCYCGPMVSCLYKDVKTFSSRCLNVHNQLKNAKGTTAFFLTSDCM